MHKDVSEKNFGRSFLPKTKQNTTFQRWSESAAFFYLLNPLHTHTYTSSSSSIQETFQLQNFLFDQVTGKWTVPDNQVVVQLLSCVRLCNPMDQASLSITISQSLFKLMSIESVMQSNHLILCLPIILPSIFPSIRVFSNELTLRIRWPKYQSFGFSISPSNDYSRLISFRLD